MEAPNHTRFCNILAKSRNYKLKGYWEGSAYCSHPCGVIRNGIIFANRWNVHDYCYANVMTEPENGFNSGCNSPTANCDPYPHPKTGKEITVYSTGSWRLEGPWQQVILDTLEELENEIEDKKLEIAWNKEIERIDRLRANNQEIADIREKFAKQIA